MTIKIALPYLGTEAGGSYRSGILLARDLSSEFEPHLFFPGCGEATRIADNYDLEYTIIENSDKIIGDIKQASQNNLLSQMYTGVSAIPYVNELRKELVEHDFDVVHTNDSRTTLVWGLAANLARIPLVWHVRGNYLSPFWNIIRLILSDHSICVSQSTAEALGPFPQLTSYSVIYNGVDHSRFNSEPGKLRDEINAEDNEYIFAYIGYLTDRKRPLLFAEAAVEVLQQSDNVHAVMIGEDKSDFSQQIKSIVQSKEVGSQFHLLGYRDNVGELLMDIDLFVLTSTLMGEGFPRVVIEAMASGTPVITTESAGAAEAVVDGKTGKIIPHDSTGREIAVTIAETLDDEDGLKQMGEAAKHRANNKFSSENIANEVSKVYRNLVFGG